MIDNALKYSKSDAQILISTHEKDHQFILSIQDNGIGISAELQKKIFNKFYRVPKGKAAGFGLGLNYVQQIIKAHEATLNIESEEQKGTTFIIGFK